MINFIKRLFKNNKTNSKNKAGVAAKRIFAGTAHSSEELLDLRYRGLKQGYLVQVEDFSSSFGKALNVYYC